MIMIMTFLYLKIVAFINWIIEHPILSLIILVLFIYIRNYILKKEPYTVKSKEHPSNNVIPFDEKWNDEQKSLNKDWRPKKTSDFKAFCYVEQNNVNGSKYTEKCIEY